MMRWNRIMGHNRMICLGWHDTNTNQGSIYRDRYFRDATFDFLQP